MDDNFFDTILKQYMHAKKTQEFDPYTFKAEQVMEFKADESTEAGKLFVYCRDMFEGDNHNYLTFKQYNSIMERALNHSYQYGSFVTDDGRPGLYFRPLQASKAWFWIRHSQSHEAKISWHTDPDNSILAKIATDDPEASHELKIEAVKYQINITEGLVGPVLEKIQVVKEHSPEIAEQMEEKYKASKKELEYLKSKLAELENGE